MKIVHPEEVQKKYIQRDIRYPCRRRDYAMPAKNEKIQKISLKSTICDLATGVFHFKMCATRVDSVRIIKFRNVISLASKFSRVWNESDIIYMSCRENF